MMSGFARDDVDQDVDQKAVPFLAALDQEEVRNELGRLCSSERHWGGLQELRIQALRSHRKRATFEIAVKTDSGWHGVIGKVYAPDRADIFRAMEAFGQAGFGPEAEFSIPQPFVHLPSLGVRLEEKVPGPSAKDTFLTGSPSERTAAAERCGRWLARFHTAAPRLGREADLGEMSSRCQRWTDELARSGGAIARKSEELFRKLQAAAPPAGAVPYCAGHGSYIPDHVILSGRRTATIDLDEYDVADPSRDVAWFTVSVRRRALTHLGSLDLLDGAVEEFVRAYVAAGRRRAIAHLAFHTAVECLHRARRDAGSEAPLGREWAEIMLDEGLRALR